LAVFCLHRVTPNPAAWTATFGAGGRWLAGALACGGRGVDVFCALSGYLITRLLLEERARTGTIAVGRFYARRALRLLPLYSATLLVTELVARYLLHRPGLGAQRIWYVALLGNVSAAEHGYPTSPAFPLWSVSLEAQAYLVWPLLLGRTEATTHATVARRFGLLVLGALAARAMLLAAHTPEPAMWCLLPCRADLFALGGLLALVPAWTTRLRRWAGGVAALAIAALVTISTVAPTGVVPSVASTVAYVPAALLSVALLVVAIERPPRAFAARPFVALGSVSYGLYALHVPTISLLRALTPRSAPSLSEPLEFLLTLATTVALATLSWHFFEAPLLRSKARFAT
jgi:peptidoglycan/LPS O-acetylase OafA/YrhL